MCMGQTQQYRSTGQTPAPVQEIINERPEVADYTTMPYLLDLIQGKRRKRIKTNPLGLDDEGTTMKTLTGQ